MKRRSITKPPNLTFFTDADAGGHRNACLPAILIDAGLTVECHDDYFEDSTHDSVWLSRCGNNDWIAITKDKKIRLEDRNIISIVESEAKVLTLIGSWTHEMLATNIINSVYVIERHVQKQRAPFMAKLHMAAPHKRERGNSGQIEIYRDRTALLKEAERIARG